MLAAFVYFIISADLYQRYIRNRIDVKMISFEAWQIDMPCDTRMLTASMIAILAHTLLLILYVRSLR